MPLSQTPAAASHDRSSKRRQILPATVLGLAALLLTACASQDKHVFESTDHLPATVTVVDTTTDQTLWSRDVPPQHKLVMDFDRDGEVEFFKVTGKPATSLRYTLKDAKGKTIESETVQLPGTSLLIKPIYQRPTE